METEPVGVKGRQRWFYNAVVSGGYKGSAKDLLKDCRLVEQLLGRVRKDRFGPRTADVDILAYRPAADCNEGSCGSSSSHSKETLLPRRAARRGASHQDRRNGYVVY